MATTAGLIIITIGKTCRPLCKAVEPDDFAEIDPDQCVDAAGRYRRLLPVMTMTGGERPLPSENR